MTGGIGLKAEGGVFSDMLILADLTITRCIAKRWAFKFNGDEIYVGCGPNAIALST